MGKESLEGVAEVPRGADRVEEEALLWEGEEAHLQL